MKLIIFYNYLDTVKFILLFINLIYHILLENYNIFEFLCKIKRNSLKVKILHNIRTDITLTEFPCFWTLKYFGHDVLSLRTEQVNVILILLFS